LGKEKVEEASKTLNGGGGGVVVITVIQFNSYLFMCKLNRPEAN
jgi:hypothetical protein